MRVPQICELEVCAAFINQRALRRMKWTEFMNVYCLLYIMVEIVLSCFYFSELDRTRAQ